MKLSPPDNNLFVSAIGFAMTPLVRLRGPFRGFSGRHNFFAARTVQDFSGSIDFIGTIAIRLAGAIADLLMGFSCFAVDS